MPKHYGYHGPSMATRKDPEPFDLHCPEMGSGLNYYKHKCADRQGDKTQAVCYRGCKATKAGQRVENWTQEQAQKNRKVIARLLKIGCTNKEIAEMTNLTTGSVSRIKKQIQDGL